QDTSGGGCVTGTHNGTSGTLTGGDATDTLAVVSGKAVTETLNFGSAGVSDTQALADRTQIGETLSVGPNGFSVRSDILPSAPSAGTVVNAIGGEVLSQISDLLTKGNIPASFISHAVDQTIAAQASQVLTDLSALGDLSAIGGQFGASLVNAAGSFLGA